MKRKIGRVNQDFARWLVKSSPVFELVAADCDESLVELVGQLNQQDARHLEKVWKNTAGLAELAVCYKYHLQVDIAKLCNRPVVLDQPDQPDQTDRPDQPDQLDQLDQPDQPSQPSQLSVLSMLNRLISLGMPRLPSCAAVIRLAGHVAELDRINNLTHNQMCRAVSEMCAYLLADLAIRQQDQAFWLVSLGKPMLISNCVAARLVDYTWYSIEKTKLGMCLVRRFLDQVHHARRDVSQARLLFGCTADQIWTASTADQLVIASPAASCVVQLDNWTVQTDLAFGSTGCPDLYGNCAILKGNHQYAVVVLPSQLCHKLTSPYLLVCWQNNQLCIAYQQDGVINVVLFDQISSASPSSQSSPADPADSADPADPASPASPADPASLHGITCKPVFTNDKNDKPVDLVWSRDKTYLLVFDAHVVQCDMF